MKQEHASELLAAFSDPSYDTRRTRLKDLIAKAQAVNPMTFTALEDKIVEGIRNRDGSLLYNGSMGMRSFCDRNNRPDLLLAIAAALYEGDEDEAAELGKAIVAALLAPGVEAARDRTGKPIFGQPVKLDASKIVETLKSMTSEHLLTMGEAKAVIGLVHRMMIDANGGEPVKPGDVVATISASLEAVVGKVGSETVRAVIDLVDDLPSFHADEVKNEKLHEMAKKIFANETTPTDKAIKETKSMTSASAAIASIIDPNLKLPLNSLLATATGGKITDIEPIFTALDGLNKANDNLKEELKSSTNIIAELRSKLATSAIIVPASGTTVHIDGSKLTYKVEIVRAGDIFTDPKGKPTSGLNMMVPKFTWEDDTGAVVDHPDVAQPKSKGGDMDDFYRPDIKVLAKFLLTLANGHNIWAYGMPGTGKTMMLYYISHVCRWPMARINLDAAVEPFQLIGSKELVNDGAGVVTKFKEGIIPQAMARPCLILLDENDYAKSDVLYALQRALEMKGLMLAEDGGRVVRPHQFARFIATGNTRGQGDEVGCFPGARVQSSAYLNRFSTFVEFDYMKKKEEKKLLLGQAPGLNEATAEALVAYANRVREAVTKGEIMHFITPRNLIPCAQYTVQLTPSASNEKEALLMAMEMTVFDAASNMDRQKLKEIADAVFK
jgi:cobaltochelatase CobS